MGKEGQKNKLRIKINTKLYSVELVSDQPVEALKEMNKFLSLANEEFDSIKEIDLLTDLDYDQYYFVPQDVRKDSKSMQFVTQQMELTDNRLYRKQILPSMKMINLDNKEVNVEVSIQELKNTLRKLLEGVDKKTVKSCLFHIKGKLSEGTKELIEDQFVKQISYVPTKTTYTEANIPDLVLEALLFGSFEGEDI